MTRDGSSRKKRLRTTTPALKVWSPDFDLSTIPDHIVHAESARRRRVAQAEPPRTGIRRPCVFCLELFGAREMRKHLPACPKRHEKTDASRSGWVLGVTTDPQELKREVYRYWQSRSVGERLAAVWDATEAAYSIRKVAVNKASKKQAPKKKEAGNRGR